MSRFYAVIVSFKRNVNMRYTESDRLSSNVEDRRHEGEEGIAGKLFRETFDYLRQLTTVKPSQPKPDEHKPEPKSKDQSSPLGVGSEGVGSEVQLPPQSMDIGQNWLDEQIAKSKLAPEPSVNDNPKPSENASKTDSSESHFPPVFDNRPQGSPPIDSNQSAQPQHLEMTSPY